MGFGRSCCKVFTVSLVPVTVFILSLLFFGGIILLPALYTELSEKEQYGFAIDAGSSHTHIYLYSWKASSANRTSQVKQVSSCRPTGGGVSSYTNATEASESIRTCLQGLIKKFVPKDFKEHVHVWFGATAGMRILRLENKTLSDEIVTSVRHTLRNITGRRQHVRILGGGEEGAAGWISTNYLKKNLKKHYPRKRDVTPQKSVGALDMGGASMQIAFQYNSITDHLFQAKLFDESWKLYSRSYLCFGANEALRRTLAFLAMEEDYSSSVDHPCLPVGSNVTVNMSYLFTDHVCTNDIVPDDDYNESTIIVFSGKSDPNGCSELVGKAMNFSQCFVNATSVVDCSDDRIPNVTEKEFVGFSEFYYVADAFNFSVINHTNFVKFNSAINNFCKLNWKQITANHSKLTYIYLREKCFHGYYVYHVLNNGLGFKPMIGNWNISLKQRIDKIDAGWALGYMLNQTYRLSDVPNNIVYPYSSADLIVGMLVLTILTVVFIVFFVFTFSACRKALKPITNGYTNIS